MRFVWMAWSKADGFCGLRWCYYPYPSARATLLFFQKGHLCTLVVFFEGAIAKLIQRETKKDTHYVGGYDILRHTVCFNIYLGHNQSNSRFVFRVAEGFLLHSTTNEKCADCFLCIWVFGLHTQPRFRKGSPGITVSNPNRPQIYWILMFGQCGACLVKPQGAPVEVDLGNQVGHPKIERSVSWSCCSQACIACVGLSKLAIDTG